MAVVTSPTPSRVARAAQLRQAMAPYVEEWRRSRPRGVALGYWIDRAIEVRFFDSRDEAEAVRTELADDSARSTARIVPLSSDVSYVIG